MSKRGGRRGSVDPTNGDSVKRRRTGPQQPSLDQVRLCQDVYDSLRAKKTEEGKYLCEYFLRAPSRRNAPDYYKIVNNPIDLMRIQQKLKTEEFDNLNGLAADIRLLVDNASLYYKEGSPERKAAIDLWTAFSEIKTKAEIGEIHPGDPMSHEPSPSPSLKSLRSNSPSCRGSIRSKDTSPGRFSVAGNDPVDQSILEEMLVSVIELTDDSGRIMSPPFRLLPSKTEYPEYYVTIQDPIDLKIIAGKIRSGEYRTLNALEKDLVLMCRNAKTFNEPSSMIHRDSNVLRKFIAQKKLELLETAMSPVEKEKAEQNAEVLEDLVGQDSAADELPEYSEDSEEDEATETSRDPLWVVYWAVRNYADPSYPDSPLGDMFCHLPSRNWYPDYYDEIKEPMSLFLINKKLKRDAYQTMADLLTDLNLVCENAKLYNIEGSEIFANACRLQVIANRKAKELLPTMETNSAWPMELPKGVEMLEAPPAQGPTSSTPVPPAGKARKAGGGNSTPHQGGESSGGTGNNKGRPGRKTLDELMTRYRGKLMQVFDAVWDYREGKNDRWVAQAFVDKPDSRQYPEYYQFIPDPIDLRMIKGKIEADQYDNSGLLKKDFELLFGNARHFNESGSQIYLDSNTLENQMKNAIKALGPMVLESPRTLKEKYGGLEAGESIQESYKRKSFWTRRGRPITQTSRARGMQNWSKTKTTGPMKEGVLPLGTMGAPGSPVGLQGTPKGPKKGSPAPAGGQEKLSKKLSGQFLAGASAEQKKLWELFNSITNYVKDGRRFSVIFQALPSRKDYPDYYDVIKKPIDLGKISARLTAGAYESFDAICQDFHLMFDNACRYNEPESGIYKDSLTLQKVLLQRKAELKGNESGIPNVQRGVQEMLTQLFVTLHTHEDEEGRCYADSLAELPELYSELNLLTLDKIKRNLDKRRYRRLDKFQSDMFSVFSATRKLSRSDSQAFEDSVELQQFFIKTRDELCKRGEHFVSPALSFLDKHLQTEVEAMKKEKIPLEQEEDAARAQDPKMSPSKKKEGETDVASLDFNGVTYKVGEFVYVRPNEENEQPHIMRIERLWTDPSLNEDFISGNWFYRPHQTYHLATRKFQEKEVFITPFHDKAVKERLMGKCYVMFIKDYFKRKPKCFEDKDVYLCESKYLGRQLHFRKLKQWPFAPEEEGVEMEERAAPLSVRRISSVFVSSDPNKQGAESVGASTNQNQERMEIDEDDDFSILEMQRENVKLISEPEEGQELYEQLCFNGIWFKLGDGVLIRSAGDYPDVLRVDKLWKTAEGDAFLSGPWFARPSDLEHEPSKVFLRRELFGTYGKPDRVVQLSSVLRLCAVMPLLDFQKYRPTEVREDEVFVVQSKVKVGKTDGDLETDRLMAGHLEDSEESMGSLEDAIGSPPPNGATMSVETARKIRLLKSYKLSPKVLDDELYYFRKPITPETEPSPLLMKVDTSMDSDMLSNVDYNESGSEIDTASLIENMSGKEMKTWLASQPKLNSRSKSGYILFSAEIRKKIMQDNKEAPFGAISKLVGEEWKKISVEEKKKYEARAQMIAEQRARADAAAGPPAGARPAPGQIVVYICKWKDCNFQFETNDQLWDHITNAHTSQIVEGDGSQYVCLWMTCAKYKKDGKPFPSLPRLHRHIKEKHMHTAVKCIFPNQKSKNFVPLHASPRPSTPGLSKQSAPGNFQYPQQPTGQPVGPGQFPSANQQYYTAQYGQQQVMVDAQGHVVQQQQPLAQGQTPGVQSSLPSGQMQQMTVQGGTVAAQLAQPPMTQAGVPIAPHQTIPATGPVPYTQDPGKSIVQVPKVPPEPVFVAPPPTQRVQRVLHSEAYLRYIESMHSAPQQNTVSKWDRAIGANPSNTTSDKRPPADWLGDGKPSTKEEVVKSLWNLREHMLKDALGIAQFMEQFPE